MNLTFRKCSEMAVALQSSHPSHILFLLDIKDCMGTMFNYHRSGKINHASIRLIFLTLPTCHQKPNSSKTWLLLLFLT